MRLLPSAILAILLPSLSSALPSFPFLIQDDLASQNSADVIGDPDFFDIDYLQLKGLSANTLQVDIRFNFGGGASLTPFNISGFAPTLSVGDLFFRTPTATYAFILNSHNGLVTNGLYQISGTQSAQTVLGNPSGSYRNSAPVWASPTGASLLSTGSRSVSTVNGKATNLLVSLYIPLTTPVLNNLNSAFDIYFAAATCGNDEIFGSVPASGVPEPGTWAMLGAGLVAIGLYRRRN